MENSPRFMEAWAQVTVAGVLTNGRGVTATALPGGAGTGIYTVTLERELNANELLPMICIDTTAANAIARLTNTTNLVKTITMFDDAGAAVDAGFYAAFWRVAWGGH
jgi:hypothetical protein